MFSYGKLWTLLRNRGLKKNDLKKNTGITPTTLSKLSKNENVSMDVLNRICVYLECDIGDIVEHVYTPYRDNDTLGTFLPNKKELIHNWFGYLEGYSKTLVETELEKLSSVKAILDPFGGSGTTPLVGVLNGIDSYYSEANPVMAFIIECKTNISIRIAQDKNKILKLSQAIEGLRDYFNNLVEISKINLYDFGGFEKYFEFENLIYIQQYKKYIDILKSDTDTTSIFKLALASIAVSVSKMIRRGDLRYAKGNEIVKTNQPFKREIFRKLELIRNDILDLKLDAVGKSTFLTPDARNISEKDLIDAVITSPPYLNGTNYIRNTKLELKLLDYVKFEADLALMHKIGIVAGINNVSKNNGNFFPLPEVSEVYKSLLKVSYDKRIPQMVAAYFNDMSDVFSVLRNVMKDKSFFIMDIGDSQFAGIHVKTHSILCSIAKKYGFLLYDDEVIRTRKSKSGFDLTQRIVRFKLCKMGSL